MHVVLTARQARVFYEALRAQPTVQPTIAGHVSRHHNSLSAVFNVEADAASAAAGIGIDSFSGALDFCGFRPADLVLVAVEPARAA